MNLFEFEYLFLCDKLHFSIHDSVTVLVVLSKLLILFFALQKRKGEPKINHIPR